VAEPVDARDLKSCGRKAVRVRVPPSAPAPSQTIRCPIHSAPRRRRIGAPEGLGLVYVLIIMLAGSGSAVGSVEFNSKQACEAAAQMIAHADRPYGGASAITVCAPKG
jgi:hypothetical protein